jgi:uncharacterized membrane protein
LRFFDLRYALFAGATNAVGNASQMYALTVILVPYVIAIKRMSTLFTVVGASIVLQENIRGRLLGVTVMLVGAGIIVAASNGPMNSLTSAFQSIPG